MHDLSLEDQFAVESKKCVITLPQCSYLCQHLIMPKRPSRATQNQHKSCGHALTSNENMKEIEEREEKEKLVLMEKEEKKRVCLEKMSRKRDIRVNLVKNQW